MCLAEERFFIGPVFNVVDKNVLAPPVFPGHADVKFTFKIIFAALKDYDVVSPTDFSRHWCEFFIL